MMRSLWSGVSGLQANQEFMDVVGNNISNVNTVGYKASLINFSDVLSQTLTGASAPQGNLGGMNPEQIGLGTQVANINKNFSQGSLQTTNITTNLAIQGNGFFIASSDGGNTYAYTRAGNFNFDANGNLVDPTGNIVQGWVANQTTHIINTASSISSINVPQNMTVPAGVTKNISIAGNLDGGQTVQPSELQALTNASSDLPQGQIPLEGNPLANPKTGYIYPINMNSLYTTNGNLIGVGTSQNRAALSTGTLGGTYTIGGNLLASSGNIKIGDTGAFAYPTQSLSDLASTIKDNVTVQPTGSNITPSFDNGVLTFTLDNSTGASDATFTFPTITADDPVLNSYLSGLSGKTVTVKNGETATVTSLPFFSTPGDAVAMSFDGGNSYNTYIYGDSSTSSSTSAGTASFTGIVGGSLRYFNTVDDLVNDISYDINGTPPGGTTPNTNATVTLNSSGEIQIVPSGNGNLNNIGTVYSNNSNLATILGTLSGAVQNTSTGATSQPFEADSYSTSIDVYDSLGNKHNVTFNFVKSNYTPSTGLTEWQWYANASASGSSAPTLTNAYGQIFFDNNGKLNHLTPPLAITAQWNNGTASQVINLHYGDPGTFDGLTQFSLPSQTTTMTQDGYQGGSLQSILVNQDGVIEGLFSNGKSYPLAQVALATFANNNGLMSKGNSLFAASANSGTPVISTAGAQGAGTIAPSTLEESNVDLGTEFTNMIIAQRAYQANTRIISTSDQMLQTLLNIQ